MSRITLYQKPTCTTCRKVYAALKDSGVDFESVNYYINPIPKTKIKSLLSKMKMLATEILRKGEEVYKELGLAKRKISQEEAVDLMAKYPDLIQRPILEKGNKAVLARPAERLREIL